MLVFVGFWDFLLEKLKKINFKVFSHLFSSPNFVSFETVLRRFSSAILIFPSLANDGGRHFYSASYGPGLSWMFFWGCFFQASHKESDVTQFNH